MTSGEVILLADNRAGVVAGLKGFASGDTAAARTTGVFNVAKGAVAFTAGDRVYWDVSGDTAIAVGSAATGDFDMGVCVATVASGAATVQVDLNAPAGTVAS